MKIPLMSFCQRSTIMSSSSEHLVVLTLSEDEDNKIVDNKIVAGCGLGMNREMRP